MVIKINGQVSKIGNVGKVSKIGNVGKVSNFK